MIPASGVGVFAFILERRRLIEKDRRTYRLQFETFLGAMDISVRAGYSLPNSMIYATGHVSEMYGDKGLLIKKLHEIENSLGVGRKLGEELVRIGNELKLEEISDFGSVIDIMSKSGGNTSEVIEGTAENISKRIQIEDEIDVMITGKKLETYIMLAMPFLIIIYLRVVNKGYMDALYEGVFGRIFMTAALGLIGVALFISKKIIGRLL